MLQSYSDVDFIVNAEGTEQLSCYNVAKFEDTLDLCFGDTSDFFIS